ncbi:AAA family ATPase [uncultured Marixanthomonas sp.]|uniref:AAA family ATPase n=1 Tax=uncultured Marixanthomonas sp. TaxID=757245 RepID=UPI0030D70FF1|tara:strand:- start:94558 stop:96510 length:1953 start_codon:yes stop_codon:yes gene_type:complete
MKLKNVTVHKYKSFETDQNFEVQDDVTILVGMNESGKTSILESIGKTNYFQNDKKFKFNKTHDYPRREKKKMDKSGVMPKAITCVYSIDDGLKEEIESKVGKNIFTLNELSVTTKYDNVEIWNNMNADFSAFIENKTKELGISSKTLNDKLIKTKKVEELDEIIKEYKDDGIIEGLEKLKPYLKNSWDWANPIQEYIARRLLKPAMPKFLYYDEYYSLPSRIVIDNLEDENIEEEEFKTAKALLELADLNAEDILEATSFEDYIAELEATEAIISDELFKYWSTNNNLSIEFKIEAREEIKKRKIINNRHQEEVLDVKIVEHILDIRVKNQRTRVSLPLKNRSKGFNWFFSFLVWFKKIQEDKNSQYILLLDEPGLNLHASAQKDMLKFIEDLSDNYQILYTTHSPFSIPSDKLERVRTVLETSDGSVISDSIQEKDPNTLFPLQAALGYDIAQNLFISNKNLLVEGVSDLIILTAISGILETENRTFLRNDITIIPTGGLEKVATFISLLRGSKLEIACLLDSYTDQKGKAKLEKMITSKIIHKSKIRFFDEFLDTHKQADLEDLFIKDDYLKLFNSAFNEYDDLKESKLDKNLPTIIKQINKQIGKDRFNHYRPANELLKLGVDKDFFSSETLDNFEKIYLEINKLFD